MILVKKSELVSAISAETFYCFFFLLSHLFSKYSIVIFFELMTHGRVVNNIFSKVDELVHKGSLQELNMSHLPSLCNKFIELIKFLVQVFFVFKRLCSTFQFPLMQCSLNCLFCQMTNNEADRDQVIILFQDMLEVVTRDIMEDDLPG